MHRIKTGSTETQKGKACILADSDLYYNMTTKNFGACNGMATDANVQDITEVSDGIWTNNT